MSDKIDGRGVEKHFKFIIQIPGLKPQAKRDWLLTIGEILREAQFSGTFYFAMLRQQVCNHIIYIVHRKSQVGRGILEYFLPKESY